MRFFILALLLSFVFSPSAIAQTEAGDSPPAAGSASTSRAAVIADEEVGVVRIMIDGTEVARFDATGLHVTGDITYSGITVDTGPTVPEAADAP